MWCILCLHSSLMMIMILDIAIVIAFSSFVFVYFCFLFVVAFCMPSPHTNCWTLLYFVNKNNPVERALLDCMTPIHTHTGTGTTDSNTSRQFERKIYQYIRHRRQQRRATGDGGDGDKPWWWRRKQQLQMVSSKPRNFVLILFSSASTRWIGIVVYLSRFSSHMQCDVWTLNRIAMFSLKQFFSFIP